LPKADLQVCQKQIYKFAKSRFTSLPKADLQVCQKQIYKFAKSRFTSLPKADLQVWCDFIQLVAS
jgi:hypothetical protein